MKKTLIAFVLVFTMGTSSASHAVGQFEAFSDNERQYFGGKAGVLKSRQAQLQRQERLRQQKLQQQFKLQREAQREAARNVARGSEVQPLYYKQASGVLGSNSKAFIERIREESERKIALGVGERDIALRAIANAGKPEAQRPVVVRALPQVATTSLQEQRELLDSLAGARTPQRADRAASEPARLGLGGAFTGTEQQLQQPRVQPAPVRGVVRGVVNAVRGQNVGAVGNASSLSTSGGQTVLGIADANQLDFDVAR